MKTKKKKPVQQGNARQINSISIPYKDPELTMQRLDTIYGACAASDLIYVDLKDKDTGEVIPVLAGVDASTDPVKLIPLAQWLTAKDVLNKAYEVWNATEGGWVDIKETKLTLKAWLELKHGKE